MKLHRYFMSNSYHSVSSLLEDETGYVDAAGWMGFSHWNILERTTITMGDIFE